MQKAFKKYVQVSDDDLTAMRVLFAESEKEDLFKSKNYWNIIKNRRLDLENDYLYFIDDKLVGYLGLFNFNPDETEICTVIHPKYRQQGIFNEMFQDAYAVIKTWDISSILFPSSQRSKTIKIISEKFHTTYAHSEYTMKLILPWEQRPKQASENVLLTIARKHDIPQLAQMDVACFNSNYDDMIERYIESIGSTTRRVWLAKVDNKNVGKMHVRFDDTLTNTIGYIHDFCIMPEYQGKKYGTDVLNRTIKFLLDNNHDDVRLDVKVDNENALKLYKNNGLEIIEAYDFWRYPVVR